MLLGGQRLETVLMHLLAQLPSYQRVRHRYLLFGLLSLLASSAFAAPGDFDSTFGGTGIVTTDFFGNSDFGAAVAVQPDGKIVVAGSVQSGADVTTSDFAVARYLPDGTLDPM